MCDQCRVKVKEYAVKGQILKFRLSQTVVNLFRCSSQKQIKNVFLQLTFSVAKFWFTVIISLFFFFLSRLLLFESTFSSSSIVPIKHHHNVISYYHNRINFLQSYPPCSLLMFVNIVSHDTRRVSCDLFTVTSTWYYL